MRDDFCAFILSHGRPDNVKTLKTLEKAGYTGAVYIVIDDDDDTEQEYRKKYGDMVLQFCKTEIAAKIDAADTSNDRRTIVYARNACFELAKQVGCRYFIELDDDYTSIEHRYIEQGKLRVRAVERLDNLIESMIEFMGASGALTVAFAQGGDFIGGAKALNFRKGILRKAMNTFICDVERPFTFVGRINEDVNTYVTLGSRGGLMFTVCSASITQTQTQKSKGGMSDVYQDGTYQKSMYTVIMHPSSVCVKEMGEKHKRLHHNIDWNSTVPKIIREKWKKGHHNA